MFLRPTRPVRWMGGPYSMSIPRYSRTPLLSTLNPLSLQASDYLDLSGHQNRAVVFAADGEGKNPLLTYRKTPSGSVIPFPAQSRGFLYFHRDPDAAPLEGGLRFRLSENELPGSFQSGQDLLLPTGSPWQLILPQVFQPKLRKFGDQLLRENLISAAQMAHCHKVFGSRRVVLPWFTLFRLTQEFPVDFGKSPTIQIVAEAVFPKQFHPFAFVAAGKNIFPFTGTGLARFEPSVVDGRRLIHLRITKITSPVVCTNSEYLGRIAEPREGELLTRTPVSGASRPWRVEVDRYTEYGAALRALWPAARIP
ncbi:hypothetical protein C8R46DRAFT_1068201 [Mycena filopes]|nr:hypothetical protein C8R46DRAFT_1068201 [Mycena filopes]